jgi:hypothetical protein
MPITAVLSRTLHEALGREAAADLVDWMQQVDTHRAELRELNELSYARLDSRMNELRQVMDSRFNEQRQATDSLRVEFRHELRAEISALRMETNDGLAEVKIALAGLESKIDRRFADLVKWSFLFWCGAVGAAALARWPR